ncbi:hypothetical protein [Actinopolymorpha sp. B9G3]|uniref:hypothetical protein n=1 Tax=Actinopolymorpha sp. B9G3 TaxID=3158970 RepID=UPI0032D94C1B
MDNERRPARLDRATFLKVAGGVAAGGVLAPWWPAASQVLAEPASEKLRVDLSEPAGKPTYSATGFLHGLGEDGTQPPDPLLLPLKAKLFRGGGSTLPGGAWSKGGYDGYAVRWQNVVDRYRRVAPPPIEAEYCIVLSDLWGAEGVTLQPTDPYPGDDGDWTSWERFLTQLVSDAHAARLDPDRIQYEIWNEPDFGDHYWPRPWEQYVQTWQRGVRLIRALDPRARIVGPTFTRMTTSGDGGHMDDWLDMAVASDTVPDILAWHDLIPNRDPVDQAGLARQLLAERGLAGVRLELNEYLPGGQLNPGFNAWYIARLQRSGIDYTALAIYGPCCMFPLLDGLLVDVDGELVTDARWWAYQRYASITGTLVTTRPTGDVDAVAGADPENRRVRVLVGNRIGAASGELASPFSVTIDGLRHAQTYLLRGGNIPIRLERIPHKAVLSEPEAVKDIDLTPKGGEVTITFDWADPRDAYVLTLGKHETDLPAYAVVEVLPERPVLLPGEPTTVTFRIRNYTDTDLTLEPRVSVPDGYTAATAASVTVPAEGDAELQVTVTRATTDLREVELRLDVGDLMSLVRLEPSDNWVRIAEMTASSTHSPSSPAFLNDGRTDPDDWGGGGANGWNDDTPGQWPDTITATWTHPITLNRVVVHTLNSAVYPASAWGVRDYDIEIQANETWQTIAQVRGNVTGVDESKFTSVETDTLRIVIHDTNDHTYSRLVEIEGYHS